MKPAKACPKCGGKDIAVMRSAFTINSDPRVRTSGGPFLSFHDFLPVERYLCCTCGYMESWVDPEQFVQKGGKSYWGKKEAKVQEENEMDAYWKEKLQEKQEQETQQEQTREKKNRRDDPWI